MDLMDSIGTRLAQLVDDDEACIHTFIFYCCCENAFAIDTTVLTSTSTHLSPSTPPSLTLTVCVRYVYVHSCMHVCVRVSVASLTRALLSYLQCFGYNRPFNTTHVYGLLGRRELGDTYIGDAASEMVSRSLVRAALFATEIMHAYVRRTYDFCVRGCASPLYNAVLAQQYLL